VPVLVSSAFAQTTIDSSVCGSLANAYGPFDYADPEMRRSRLPIVEIAHFNNDVASLKRGLSGTVLDELDYTLRAFPNHHLALDAMARLHEREGTNRIRGARYSLECWFERAQRLNPRDGVVRMVFGVHLMRTGKLEDAEKALVEARELNPDSAEAHYNLGLLYVRRGKYPEARDAAERAYSLGFPLPGLRDQLKAKGHWTASE
jgi:tetratricopeptide (TPR) repeat protein